MDHLPDSLSRTTQIPGGNGHVSHMAHAQNALVLFGRWGDGLRGIFVERNSAPCRESSNDLPEAFHYLGSGIPGPTVRDLRIGPIDDRRKVQGQSRRPRS
jgi:hypothetical protein